jgi:membrane protein YdbS with pleckstrin-like domain
MTSLLASRGVERAGRWFYEGLWGVLARWFRVPQEPPSLPCLPGDSLESFRPAEGFLKYLKFQYWLVLAIVAIPLTFGWIAMLIAFPLAVLVATPLALVVVIVPAAAAYLAIHLRYDSTWYVMTGRSLRIRRGIWIIHETTITFENVQNVEISQGPLQRWFGVADVLVDTAGGSAPQPGHQGAAAVLGHRGLIEGIADAPRIRDLILDRLRRSQSAGLGDEPHQAHDAESAWTAAQVSILREIRDAAAELANKGTTDLR